MKTIVLFSVMCSRLNGVSSLFHPSSSLTTNIFQNAFDKKHINAFFGEARHKKTETSLA